MNSNMKDEQKAIEITKEVSLIPNLTEFEAMTLVARKMAKWKDEQLRGILEAIHDNCPRSKARHYLVLLNKDAL